MAENIVVGNLRTVLGLDSSSFDSGAKKASTSAQGLANTLKTSMQGVEMQFKVSERAVANFEKSLRGDRLLATANNLADAFHRVGGAAKLTDEESARLNATLDKAIKKYERLGIEAPESLRKAHTETKKVTSATTDMVSGMSRIGRENLSKLEANRKLLEGMGSAGVKAAAGASVAATGFSKLAGTVGQVAAGFTLANALTSGARAIVDLGRKAVDTAGQLVDLSNKTGLSIDSLQRMQFVATQTGGSMEQFADATFRLGTRIEGGSKNVRRALEAIGLSFEHLRTLRPDQQFELVAQALGKVGDASRRNQLGVELFGRSFGNVAGAIAEGYAKIAAGATTATDEQIKALDEAADAWDRFKQRMVTGTVALLGAPLAFNDLLEKLSPFMTTDERGMASALLKFKGREEAMKFLHEIERRMDQMDARDKAREGTATSRKVIEETKSFQDQLVELDATIAALEESERKELDAALEMGVGMQELEDRFGLTEAAIRRYQSQQKEVTKELKETSKEAEKAADAIHALGDDISGLADIEAAEKMAAALERVQKPKSEGGLGLDIRELTTAQQQRINKVMADAIAAYQRLAREVPAAIKNAFDKSVSSQIEITQDILRQMGPGGIDEPFVFTPDAAFLRGWDEAAERQTSMLTTGEELNQLWEEQFDILHRTPVVIDQAAESTRTWMHDLQDTLGVVNQGVAAIHNLESALDSMATSTSRAANVANGAMAGAQAFSFLGPYGALFGLGAGALAGSMQDPRSNALMALNEFRTNIIRQFQETATMTQQLEAGNDRWRQMTILVRDAYEDLGMTAADAQRDVDRLFDSDDLLEYQRNLERINEAFLRQNELADARVRRQELLNEAVERWGLSFEEAGKGFQRGSLASQAELLIQDFQLLTESGADMQLVVERMSGAVNEFVKQAVETGTEVPEAMRPLLEAMVDAGLLTDKTGKVVENLSDAGIRFGTELEGMFERVLEKLDTLIARLMAPFSDVPLGRFGPQTGSTAVQRVGPPPDRDVFKTPDPLEATYNPFWPIFRFHEGGMVKRAHGGMFLKSDETPLIAQTGESVLSRFATKLIGGEHGVNALNMGMSPFSGMGSALSGMGQSFSTSAAELLRGSIRDASGGAGIRMSDGDGELSISIAQMTVVSNDPRKAAETIAKELPNAINTNLHGVRTKLRKQLR